MISEQEYVINRFDRMFSVFAGRKIILHGSRNYAEAIIAAFDGKYRFAAVMTFDETVGDSFCGKPVITDEELEELCPDMIILTERVKYAEEAYRHMMPYCRQRNVLLYNMYGLDEIAMHRDIDRTSASDYQAWVEYTEQNDVLMIEAMGTYLINDPLHTKLCARPELHRLTAWARGKGIPVYFSLRKSFSEEKQIAALLEDGLYDSQELEQHLIRRSGEDLSFRRFREEHGNPEILYIGSGLINECILPRYYGYHTCRYAYTGVPIPENFTYNQQFLKELDLKSQKKYRDIYDAVEQSEIISFDVFDTLLVRKVLYPTDVFSVMENHPMMKKTGIENFAVLRIYAEHDVPYGNIDAIYAELQQVTGLDEDSIRIIKELEIQTEKNVLTARKQMKILMEEILKKGKEVVLTTDMYLPSDTIAEILNENGIEGYSRIFNSCEYKKAKETGLFAELKKYAQGRRVLHIGDNYGTDIACAEQYGIQAIHVPSVMQTALAAGWEDTVRKCSTLSERCLVGLSLMYAYNNPFAELDPEHLTEEETLRRYGYAKMAPLIVGHGIWLINMIKNKSYDRVLFYARDGYLPLVFYSNIRERYLKEQIPEGVYFHTNRHSAFAAAADMDQGISYFAELGKTVGLNPRETLMSYYGVSEELLDEIKETESAEEYIKRHFDIISIQAQKRRAGYDRYFEKLGIKMDGCYATVDFVSAGTAQAYLHEFTNLQMDGYFFGNYEVGWSTSIKYYLKKENPALMNNYIDMEGSMTDFDPSLDYIDENGECVFAVEVRTADDLRKIRKIHDAVREYLNDYAALFYFQDDMINPAIPEEMYAAGGYLSGPRNTFDDWGKFTF